MIEIEQSQLSEKTPSERLMKEQTRAYMAGLMDSEGCFGVYQEKHGHFTPHIICTSSFLPLKDWLVSNFGGVCTDRVIKPYKPYFHWQLNGSRATPEFLRSILPYLRVKQEQALLMIKFLSAKQDKNESLQQELCTRIKELKSEPRNDCTLDGNKTDKNTCAYLAGVFDGEGSISLACHKRPPVKEGNKETLHYLKFLCVTNTDLSLLNLFKKIYGGFIRAKKQPNKQCYEWQLTTKDDIEKFLLSVIPYCIIKKERAKIMLEFIRLSDGHLNPKDRYMLYAKMRLLVTTKNAKPMVQSELYGDIQSDTEGTQ